MQNHPIRAAGGAMSVTRRSALRSLFAGTLAASAGVAIVAAPFVEAAPVADDAEIFALAKEYQAAHRAWYRAIDAEAVAARAFYAQRTERPKEPQYSPEDVAKVRMATLADWAEGRVAQPEGFEEAMTCWRADFEAWQASDDRLRKRCKVDATERATAKAIDKADRIATKLMRTRARTPAGMLAKIRVQDKASLQGGIFERELAKDLRAMTKAASAPTGGRA